MFEVSDPPRLTDTLCLEAVNDTLKLIDLLSLLLQLRLNRDHALSAFRLNGAQALKAGVRECRLLTVINRCA